MEFQFDLVWREARRPRRGRRLAESLTAEPVVLINDGTRDDPIVLERLFKP